MGTKNSELDLKSMQEIFEAMLQELYNSNRKLMLLKRNTGYLIFLLVSVVISLLVPITSDLMIYFGLV